MSLQPSQGGEGDFNTAPFTGDADAEVEFEAWLDTAVSAIRGENPTQGEHVDHVEQPEWVEASGIPSQTIDLTGRSMHQRDLPPGQPVRINVPGSTVYFFPAHSGEASKDS